MSKNYRFETLTLHVGQEQPDPATDAVAAIAHRHGLPLVVDNTISASYWVRPIEHGADIVVHSATKFFGGHGTTLGGVIVEAGYYDWKASGKFLAIAAPNSSYHGISFADAAGSAAFVTYIRAILLRDTGISRVNTAWMVRRHSGCWKGKAYHQTKDISENTVGWSRWDEWFYKAPKTLQS